MVVNSPNWVPAKIREGFREGFVCKIISLGLYLQGQPIENMEKHKMPTNVLDNIKGSELPKAWAGKIRRRITPLTLKSN